MPHENDVDLLLEHLEQAQLLARKMNLDLVIFLLSMAALEIADNCEAED
jgi:hypothetical protein